MDRNEEIIKYIDIQLKYKDSLDTKSVMNELNVSKMEIFTALYSKGGYAITGALVDYGSISKLK